jgi:amino acid adenylation domain-containing protein
MHIKQQETVLRNPNKTQPLTETQEQFEPNSSTDTDTPLLTATELELLTHWNATRRDYPTEICVPQLVEVQAAVTPAAVAVVLGKQALNYDELNRRANQLAHYLRTLGIDREVLVGICMERSPELIISLLAVLKAGGAYVPLDPTYPPERLAFMLNDTQAPILLTSTKIVTQLPEVAAKIICLDGAEQLWLDESCANPTPLARTNDLAYIIYTSGSLGQPKGVQITHSSLLNMISWHQDYFSIDAHDRSTQFASPSFDVTVEEIWPYLTCGASVYLLPDDHTRIMPEVLRDWMVHNSITISMLPTALVENLITLDWPPETALRYVLTGGDTLYQQPPASLPFTLINNYGLTETTVVATCEPVAVEGTGIIPPPIGRPLANTQIYLLDEQLHMVPIGERGEMYIGGACLARGYLNRPELTAQRFITNPFSHDPHKKLYKTGDMARYLPDGRLVFLGRADYQVKIRGHRVEPGEIEQVLRTHPTVHDAVVLAKADHHGEKRLVAYAVPCEGQSLAERTLHEYIAEQVPSYMVPGLFVLMEKFPINTNGKVDRKALPEPQTTLTQDTATLNAALEARTTLTPQQQQLLRLWEELLDVRPIGLHDNFFYLGGHSLLAARLLTRIHQECGQQVAYATLFAGPTIAQLAASMDPQVTALPLNQQNEPQNRAAIHTIQPPQSGSNLQPFFYLHGDWTGKAFYCYTLAQACGPEQPFYVLEPFKFTGMEQLPTLQQIAAEHIAALRSVQPHGPYLLGGFCNGGLLAYEMAQQLHAAGEQIDLLALVTPSGTNTIGMLHTLILKIGALRGYTAQQNTLSYIRIRHALRHIYRTLRPNNKHVLDFADLVALDARLKKMFPPIEALLTDYVGVFSSLATNYSIDAAQAYPGTVAFFGASDEPEIRETWLPVLEAQIPTTLEAHTLPGTHMSCVTEQVAALEQRLSYSLRRVQKTQQRHDETHKKTVIGEGAHALHNNHSKGK